MSGVTVAGLRKTGTVTSAEEEELVLVNQVANTV